MALFTKGVGSSFVALLVCMCDEISMTGPSQDVICLTKALLYSNLKLKDLVHAK